MDVKQIQKMEYLPKVFLTPDLVKHMVTYDYSDCQKYVSKSGRYIYGCLKYTPNVNEKIKEVKGIYYKPTDPIISIELKKRLIYSIDDVKEFIKSLENLFLKNINRPLLLIYDNNSLYGYTKFYKGRIYEFPIIGNQGNLKIYQVPPPPDEITNDSFVTYHNMNFYNHTVTSENGIKIYRGYSCKAGNGILAYSDQGVLLKIESPEYGNMEIEIPSNTWFLISHPRPKKQEQK